MTGPMRRAARCMTGRDQIRQVARLAQKPCILPDDMVVSRDGSEWVLVKLPPQRQADREAGS
jgi:hypothetical protein